MAQGIGAVHLPLGREAYHRRTDLLVPLCTAPSVEHEAGAGHFFWKEDIK
jgi:hypothetical protein